MNKTFNLQKSGYVEYVAERKRNKWRAIYNYKIVGYYHTNEKALEAIRIRREVYEAKAKETI